MRCSYGMNASTSKHHGGNNSQSYSNPKNVSALIRNHHASFRKSWTSSFCSDWRSSWLFLCPCPRTTFPLFFPKTTFPPSFLRTTFPPSFPKEVRSPRFRLLRSSCAATCSLVGCCSPSLRSDSCSSTWRRRRDDRTLSPPAVGSEIGSPNGWSVAHWNLLGNRHREVDGFSSGSRLFFSWKIPAPRRMPRKWRRKRFQPWLRRDWP